MKSILLLIFVIEIVVAKCPPIKYISPCECKDVSYNFDFKMYMILDLL